MTFDVFSALNLFAAGFSLCGAMWSFGVGQRWGVVLQAALSALNLVMAFQ